MNRTLPVVAVTLGDPSGIGPEVAVKALATPSIRSSCRAVIVGDGRVVRGALDLCGVELPLCRMSDIPSPANWPGDAVPIIDLPVETAALPAPGTLSAASGAAAVRWVECAVDLAVAGAVEAIVTAPLNKAAMRLAGHAYDGHTELLATRTGASGVCMLLAGERLRVAHVTGHRALADAAVCPSAARLRRVITLTLSALRRLGLERPRLAVAGLNPHAGEGGLFGRDEIEVIGPAIVEAQSSEPDAAISGPYPADTIFRRAAAGEFDGVVAMYHDQGHIPIKMIEFDTAVNVTLGLPIIRTSPDHGTAFDIAGRGIANATNMVAAIRMAVQMAGNR
jgi:4-hydroxythreonine-4-phosphate dehydrogenase